MADYLAFIISTGRCGTQWIARSLGSVYSGLLDVTHEPLYKAYNPRLMLGVSGGGTGTAPAEVTEHVFRLGQQPGSYLECGHTCWSSIPYMLRQFGPRMRIIHLTRHPVPVSLSWLTHGAYEPPLLPHIEEKILLSPNDSGARYPRYWDSWQQLAPFEKCLYYWTEVNALALDLEQRVEVPWLRLAYEDLFGGDGLSELLEFLELPVRPEILSARSQRHDEFRYVISANHEWRLVERHSEVVRVAGILGYDVMSIEEDDRYRRYVQGQ